MGDARMKVDLNNELPLPQFWQGTGAMLTLRWKTRRNSSRAGACRNSSPRLSYLLAANSLGRVLRLWQRTHHGTLTVCTCPRSRLSARTGTDRCGRATDSRLLSTYRAWTLGDTSGPRGKSAETFERHIQQDCAQFCFSYRDDG
ncbi:hypothetical protein QAD02_017321 [Eretmocerus hayati]|uniref:Uncharacterized protein n=1 Tax=Eretmocerus hayati TaxID=131215 RepID=A0ACC2PG38_9HYME|nr:hypothetical protein QAD02_017321 [Eretmocerus hayati]